MHQAFGVSLWRRSARIGLGFVFGIFFVFFQLRGVFFVFIWCCTGFDWTLALWSLRYIWDILALLEEWIWALSCGIVMVYSNIVLNWFASAPHVRIFNWLVVSVWFDSFGWFIYSHTIGAALAPQNNVEGSDRFSFCEPMTGQGMSRTLSRQVCESQGIFLSFFEHFTVSTRDVSEPHKSTISPLKACENRGMH